jgi:hypothetical protein
MRRTGGPRGLLVRPGRLRAGTVVSNIVSNIVGNDVRNIVGNVHHDDPSADHHLDRGTLH